MSGGVGFRYITQPTNWPKFWLDLMDIPDLDRARWRHPGDSVRLRMRLAGRIADLHMTLVELRPPAPCPSGGTAGGVVAEGDPVLEPHGSDACWGQVLGTGPGFLRETRRLSEEGDAKRMNR